MKTDLLDRYLYAVGRRLPGKQKEDILNELRSLLLDTLDARTGGAEPTEDDVAAVLKEFGSPTKVAAKYAGDKYLIGPLLYPGYKLVLIIVLAALAFGLLMSFAVGAAFSGDSDVGKRILQFLGSLISSCWGAIGIVTVIFWAIERLTDNFVDKLDLDHWDPRALVPVPKESGKWKPSDSIVSIVFTILGIMLFNYFPDLIALYGQDSAGVWRHIPLLSPDALAAYLPFWDIGWALTLVLHAVALGQGGWRKATGIARIALNLYNIVVLVLMLNGPGFFNAGAAEAASTGLAAVYSTVFPILNTTFRAVFVFAIIGSVVEGVRGALGLARNNR